MPGQSDLSRTAPLCADDFGTISQFISSVGRGHEPVAVLLTCCELGETPEFVAHAEPGEVLVIQNTAGIVPPFGSDVPDSTPKAIRFAISFPTVRHLIVCGHCGCRMVPVLLSNRRPDLLPKIRRILREVRETADALGECVSEEERRLLLLQEVILQQLRHLKSYPDIQKRMNDENLKFQGWLYHEETAIVHGYDPVTDRFLP